MVGVGGRSLGEANCQRRPSLSPSLPAKGVPAKQTSETSDRSAGHSPVRAGCGSCGRGAPFSPELWPPPPPPRPREPAKARKQRRPLPNWGAGGGGGGTRPAPDAPFPAPGDGSGDASHLRRGRPPAGRPGDRSLRGEEEGSGRRGGDLPGLDDSHGRSPNPRQLEKALSPLIGRDPRGPGLRTPGGRGGAERVEAAS